MNEKSLIAWVEDDEDYRRLVSPWLHAKYDLIGYSDAARLLDDLDDGLVPDLFVLDVSLPGIDGVSLYRKLMKDPRVSKAPVLFLSGSPVDSPEAYGAAGTVSAYLQKPVRKRELLNCMDSLINNSLGDIPFRAIPIGSHCAIPMPARL